MDMLHLLSKISELQKLDESKTDSRIIKGKYGTEYQGDSDEDDEQKDKKKEVKADQPKRGRGRPKKSGGEAETSSKYSGAKELQSWIVGNVPKSGLPGKKGKVHKLSDKEETKKKATKKSTLKDWIEEINQTMIAETSLPTVAFTKPAGTGTTKPIKAELVTTGNINPDLAKGLSKELSNPSSGMKLVVQGDTQSQGQQSTASTQSTQPIVATEETVEEAGKSKKSKKWIKGAIEEPGAFTKKAKSHGKTPAEFSKEVLANKEKYPAKTEKEAVLARTLSKLSKGKKSKVKEADMPLSGAEPSPLSKDNRKSKTTWKNSFRESAEGAEAINEGRDMHRSAYHEGKAHAMGEGHYRCRYDEGSEEHRNYHQGFKEGLDECYGGMMEGTEGALAGGALGLAATKTPAGAITGANLGSEVQDAFTGEDAEMEEAWESDLDEVSRGEWIKQQDAKAERSGKKSFRAFGQSFDTDAVHEDSMFEGWESQLNSLLTEGLTVTTSTGQHGAPDSVSVSATAEDAAALLQLLQNSGITSTGAMPRGEHSGHMSPMSQVRGDTDNGEPNMAAVSVRTMPDGKGMSISSDYKEEEPVEPYEHDTIIGALSDGSAKFDGEGEVSTALGSLRDRLMALEAKDLVATRGKTLPMPKGEMFSKNVEEDGRESPQAEDRDAVEGALESDAKKNKPAQSTGKKSIYVGEADERLGADTESKVKDPNPSTQTMRMPDGKGFSAAPTEKSEEIAEPTTPEEVIGALTKDSKKETEADREFKALKKMLDAQNMVDGKKKTKVAEGKDDDTSADSGMIALSMPLGKGVSTNPTEDGREAPEAAPVGDVLDAIAKDNDGEVDHDSEFQALKRLIAAHIKMPGKENVGAGAPNEPKAPAADTVAADSDFENSEDEAEEKQSKANKDVDSSNIGRGDGGEESGEKEKVDEDETDAQRAFKVSESAKSKCNECGGIMEDDHKCSSNKMKHFCKECGVVMKEGHKCAPEKLEEWANSFADGKSAKDETFVASEEFMLDTISGGANKIKRDQTTLPHTEVSIRESSDSLKDWLKLSGLK